MCSRLQNGWTGECEQSHAVEDDIAVTRPSGFSRQGTLLYRETTRPLTMTDEILRVL